MHYVKNFAHRIQEPDVGYLYNAGVDGLIPQISSFEMLTYL